VGVNTQAPTVLTPSLRAAVKIEADATRTPSPPRPPNCERNEKYQIRAGKIRGPSRRTVISPRRRVLTPPGTTMWLVIAVHCESEKILPQAQKAPPSRSGMPPAKSVPRAPADCEKKSTTRKQRDPSRLPPALLPAHVGPPQTTATTAGDQDRPRGHFLQLRAPCRSSAAFTMASPSSCSPGLLGASSVQCRQFGTLQQPNRVEPVRV